MLPYALNAIVYPYSEQCVDIGTLSIYVKQQQDLNNFKWFSE